MTRRSLGPLHAPDLVWLQHVLGYPVTPGAIEDDSLRDRRKPGETRGTRCASPRDRAKKRPRARRKR